MEKQNNQNKQNQQNKATEVQLAGNIFNVCLKQQYLNISVVSSKNKLYEGKFCNDSLQEDVKLIFSTIQDLYEFFQGLSKQQKQKKNEQDDTIEFDQKGQIIIKMSIKIKDKQIKKNVTLHVQPQSIQNTIKNIKAEAKLQIQKAKLQTQKAKQQTLAVNAKLMQLSLAIHELNKANQLLKQSNQTTKDKYQKLKQKQYKKHLQIQQQRNMYKELALINQNMKQYIQKLTSHPYQKQQQESSQESTFVNIKGGLQEQKQVPLKQEDQQEQQVFQNIYTVQKKYKKMFKKCYDDDFVKYQAEEKQELYKVFKFVPYNNNQWNQFYNYYHIIRRKNSEGWCQVVSNKPIQFGKKTVLRFKVIKKDANKKISLAIGLITQDRIESASSFGQPESISYVFDQYSNKVGDVGFVTEGKNNLSINALSAFGRKIGDVLTIQVDLQKMIVIWKINEQHIRTTDLNKIKAFTNVQEEQNKGAEAILKQKIRVYGFLQFGYDETEIAVKYSN